MTMEKEHEFIITINDGFCTYEYKLPVTGKQSIDEVARAIFLRFSEDFKEGVLIK